MLQSRPLPALTAARPPDAPLGFGGVVFDPPAVCLGEQTTIRAKRRYPGGRPENLVTTINGKPGTIATFQLMSGEPGMRRLMLTTRDPKTPDRAFASEGFVEIKDCYAPATLIVSKVPNGSVDRFEFNALLTKLSALGG